MIEADQLRQIGEDMAAVDRFIRKGEMTPPALPIEESGAVQESYQEAARHISALFIQLLKDDKVADILLGDSGHPQSVNESSEFGLVENRGNRTSRAISRQGMAITLEREDGKPARVVIGSVSRGDYTGNPSPLPSSPLYQGQKTAEEMIQEFYARYQSNLKSRFPNSEGNDWQFSQQIFRKEANPNTSITITHGFDARKDLETTDLASHSLLFTHFVRGAGKLFKLAHNRIDRLTLMPEEAERLARTTEACNNASQLIETALRS